MSKKVSKYQKSGFLLYSMEHRTLKNKNFDNKKLLNSGFFPINLFRKKLLLKRKGKL